MEYQNLFTQVQPVGPSHQGVPLGKGNSPRTGRNPWINHLLGRIGNAQLGPIYLGGLGLASLIFGTVAFTLIGVNYLSQVNWNPVMMIKNLFWLSVDPPSAKYGLRMPPMNEGGWHIMIGMFLLASVLLWWARGYRRAKELGLGTHVPWAFAATIWLFLVLGFFRPILMGNWGEGVPYGIFSHLDWTAAFSLRYGNLFYNFSYVVHCVFVRFGLIVCHARRYDLSG
jgi:photosynthetic reaction center M subunit